MGVGAVAVEYRRWVGEGGAGAARAMPSSRKFIILITVLCSHRRRIYTEEKANFVAVVWGTYLNAALAI